MARDPERIDRVLLLLGVYWKAHPDLRLGQIIGNFAEDKDLYYLEDDELMLKIASAFHRGEIT